MRSEPGPGGQGQKERKIAPTPGSLPLNPHAKNIFLKPISKCHSHQILLRFLTYLFVQHIALKSPWEMPGPRQSPSWDSPWWVVRGWGGAGWETDLGKVLSGVMCDNAGGRGPGPGRPGRDLLEKVGPLLSLAETSSVSQAGGRWPGSLGRESRSIPLI